MGSCWFNQLWPSQQSCLDILNFLDGQRSFGGGKLKWAWWHMWMGSNVDRFTCYIWRGWEPLLCIIFILSVDLVYLDLASSCCLAGLQCCWAQGVPERESHLFPWETSWESLSCIAPHPSLRPSIILQSQHYVCSRILLSCSVLQWRIRTPLLGRFLSRGCLPSLEKSARKIFEHISYLGSRPKCFSSPIAQPFAGTTSFCAELLQQG